MESIFGELGSSHSGPCDTPTTVRFKVLRSHCQYLEVNTSWFVFTKCISVFNYLVVNLAYINGRSGSAHYAHLRHEFFRNKGGAFVSLKGSMLTAPSEVVLFFHVIIWKQALSHRLQTLTVKMVLGELRSNACFQLLKYCCAALLLSTKKKFRSSMK